MDGTARTNLEAIRDTLSSNLCSTFEECLALSRRQFQTRFHDKIAQVCIPMHATLTASKHIQNFLFSVRFGRPFKVFWV